MLYFAYGSNMSWPRLAARVSSSHPLGVARADGYCLCFHKQSADGSSKCDIVRADSAADTVYGVVYELDEKEKAVLDRYEDFGRGYDDFRLEVTTLEGEILQAFSYYALRIDPDSRPFDWYKAHVLAGAREHGLPAAYIRTIEAVETIPDPDPKRRAREMAIYEAILAGDRGGPPET